MTRYSFGPPRSQPGADSHRAAYPHGTMVRDIRDGDKKIGQMFYVERHGGEVHVQYIVAGDERLMGGGAPGSVGMKGMRELGAQLKSEGVTSVSGERISGTRENAMLDDPDSRGTEIKVSLTGDANVIGGKSVGRKVTIGRGGDQPRVPAGSPEGGEFASRG